MMMIQIGIALDLGSDGQREMQSKQILCDRRRLAKKVLFSNKMVVPLSESSSNPNLENLLGDNKRWWDRKNGGTRPHTRPKVG